MQLLIECFSGEDSIRHKFSEKFMDLLLRVIREKKDKLQIKTLTHLVWSFAKTPELISNPQILELLIELRDYDRLR